MSGRPTALVTGGAGFVGSHVCESLLEDGYRVVCLDNLSSGRRANVEGLGGERLRLVEGDVREPVASQVPVDADVDRVYHLASRASPADFDAYPLEIARTNGEGTYNVLEFARATDARTLYASTSEVYGEPAVHPQPEHYNGSVNPRGPRACYDESKRYGETLAAVFHREYGVDVRTVRIFNTYGPRMRPDDGRVVPTFLGQALDGRDVTVYGDGTQTRSFLYVDDLVRGMRALMAAPDAAGEVVNVGNTDEIEIRRLAEMVIRLTGADVGVTHEPLPHEDEPERRRPVIRRMEEEFGWEPTVALEDGLRMTAERFP